MGGVENNGRHHIGPVLDINGDINTWSSETASSQRRGVGEYEDVTPKRLQYGANNGPAVACPVLVVQMKFPETVVR